MARIIFINMFDEKILSIKLLSDKIQNLKHDQFKLSDCNARYRWIKIFVCSALMVCKLIISINSIFNNKFNECINKSIYLKYSHRLKIYRFNVFNTRILDSVVHRKLPYRILMAPSSPVSITRRYARKSQIAI